MSLYRPSYAVCNDLIGLLVAIVGLTVILLIELCANYNKNVLKLDPKEAKTCELYCKIKQK